MLERYLLLWLTASSYVAFRWPNLLASLPARFLDSLPPPYATWMADPFVASKPILPWLITITMFCIGMMLPRAEIRQVFRRWPTVFAGTAIQYSVMPLLAFAAGKLFGLTGDAFIGIVMVGCVPGAMASNVLTLNARGNTSYSVGLTTAATLLSPLAVPGVLALALSTTEGVDRSVLVDSSFTLLKTVVLPVLVGHAVTRCFPALESKSRGAGVLIANLAILWIIATVVGLTRESLAQFDIAILGALLVVNVIGYAAGYAGGWGLKLEEPMRRALTLEVGMQNAGLGATLATVLFKEQPDVAIAPAMYTFACMLTGTILARYWAARSSQPASSDEPLKPHGLGE
jgi:BASS family bile acid:Na+ symporter